MKDNSLADATDAVLFKGGAFMGRSWLFCSHGTWPLGELIISQKGINLALPWKKVILRWEQVSDIKVKYGISLYLHHSVPEVNPYLVFVTRQEDRAQIANLLSEYGYAVNFR